MPRPPPLTDQQRREIPRLRSAGLQYKQIARVVGCTAHQARLAWRLFADAAYAGKHRASAKRSAHINRGLVAIMRERTVRAERTEAERREIAQRALTLEITIARAEAATAPPFKPGELAW